MKKTLLLLALALALSLPAPADEGQKADPFPFRGEYRLESGGWITVTRSGVTDELAKPMFIDWESGRNGLLAAAGTDRLVSPPPAAPDASWQTELVFRRDAAGRLSGLTIGEKGEKPRNAELLVPWKESRVTFASGEIVLAGTLLRPAGRGPFPAVVLVHGSGPGTRLQLAPMASFFARLGMAVLAYDKRGCGASGGDWKQVDLEALAADASAGVKWLRGRKEIDSKRVGLWGISQGGWVTPLAAAMDPTVAFVINSSGPGTSLRRQDLYMMANVLKAHGMGEEEIALAVETFSTLYDFARGKAAAESLDELSAKMRQNPALKEIALPPASEITPALLYAQQAIGDPAWFYHLDPDRDALAPYRRLTCPLLVTYGKLDITVPVEESAQLINQVLLDSAHPDFVIALLPATGHGFARMQEGNPPVPVVPGRISREFFATIEKWLRQHGFCASSRSNPL